MALHSLVRQLALDATAEGPVHGLGVVTAAILAFVVSDAAGTQLNCAKFVPVWYRRWCAPNHLVLQGFQVVVQRLGATARDELTEHLVADTFTSVAKMKCM